MMPADQDLQSRMRKISRPQWLFSSNALLGIAVGIAGGVVRGLAIHHPLLHSTLFGAAIGLLFAFFLARRASSAGAGLIWGLGSAFTIWLLMPARLIPVLSGTGGPNSMLVDARLQFPELVADLLCLGMPIGLALGIYGATHSNLDRPSFKWGRAIVAGGLAGIFSGLIFGYWMLVGRFFPLLAGLGDLPGHSTAVVLQFAIALMLGGVFGLLFQHDVRSYGSCMGWGLGFAILWWFVGPLTLFPALMGIPLDWSAQSAGGLSGPLIGHILYGLILGVSYATFDRIWIRLFIQSDPLNRRPDGPGLHLLRSLQWGATAGFAGGLASSPAMIASGALSRVAGTDTHFSGASGLITHLLISTLVGMSFGLLFRDESSGLGVGVLWGCLFGLIWWYAGPVTLLPLILTGQIDWRASAIASLLPALIGHLLYGGSTAFVFLFLERHYMRRIMLNPRMASQELLRLRPIGTPAPALWMFAIGLGMLLPILLS
jgi:hypothetical protein